MYRVNKNIVIIGNLLVIIMLNEEKCLFMYTYFHLRCSLDAEKKLIMRGIFREKNIQKILRSYMSMYNTEISIH